MYTYREIMDRLKLYFKAKSDRQIAEKLGINYNTIKTWSNRGKIPLEKLLVKLQNEPISINWLLTGEGEMYKTPHIQNSIVAQGNNHKIIGNIIGNSTDNELKELCEVLKKLPEKKRKYYYHRIMADYLEMEEKE